MALREIKIYPARPLRERAEPVTKVDEEIRKLVDDMAETMYAAPGVGLAANQVGVLKRVIVIDVDYSEEGNTNLIVLINPEIVEHSDTITWEEGCLSFPGINVDIERWKKVRVKALNRGGEPFEIEGEDLLAVALQHEIDHLNGITMVDKVSFLKRKMIQKELKKAKEAKETKEAKEA